MLKSPQQKGKQFERDMAKYLAKKFELPYKNSIRRTPCSGGIHEFMPQDIICMDKNSILARLHIECKNTEKLNHHQVYWRTRHIARAGTIPIVIHKKNFDIEPTIIIGLEDFCNLLLEIEELKRGIK